MKTLAELPRSDSFGVWGGIAVVAVTDHDALDVATSAVHDTIGAFDRACSRFREDSELSALNSAGGEPVRASRLLLDAVNVALRAARLTDGDVDPTVGQALVQLGYDRTFGAVADGQTGAAARTLAVLAPVPGWRVVDVDQDEETIRMPSGVSLDLGATAKALAADHAAAAAHAAAGCGVLVSLSGDIATSGPCPSAGWRIRVTDDHRADERAAGQSVTIRSGGLATSSTTVRRWTAAGSEVHHLIDPATSRPVRGFWRTVSVTAGSCVDANIASTAAIVRGRSAALWLQSLGLPSRLVSSDGTVAHLAGWPTEGDDLA